MVHKPKHRVHSFRGLLADGGQDEINLERQNVNLAYRIVKFQVVCELPGASNYSSVSQVWKEEQTAAVATVNFSDADLLAVGLWSSHATTISYPDDMTIIFDQDLFSRNIYVTQQCLQGGSVNYYLEIEEVPVNAATLMQLKLGTARKLLGGSMGK